MKTPPQTITVRGGVFYVEKVTESFVGNGVVGKKRLGLQKKG